ncbi:MAG: ribosomal protein S18-alanine N-acetyltransferase [Vulcanimicrobiaceae bacterium]
MPELSIEPMLATDVRDVLRIERASFTTQWPADAFYTELTTNKVAHYYVGRLGDEVVAYGGIWVILEDSHVTTVAVDPVRRGQRLGERMMAHLIAEATQRGAAWITLEVRESNVIAQRLYRKYGFTTVTVRKGYYTDNDENALVMWAGNLRGALYQHRFSAQRAMLA